MDFTWFFTSFIAPGSSEMAQDITLGFRITSADSSIPTNRRASSEKLCTEFDSAMTSYPVTASE